MMRLFGVTSWILIGGALAGGGYWGFLNTPESSVGSLLLSAVLAIVALSLVAITLNGAILAWDRGWSRGVIRGAATGAPAILPALAMLLAIWWIVGRATGWVEAHSGEISAWFIARLGRENITPLFTTVTWVGRWLRWVLAPLLALSLMAAISSAGWSAAFRATWLRRALSPVRLGLSTLWFAVLVAAPWIYLAPWRPRGLPATTTEMIFIAAKLLVTAVLMATGAALMVREVARPAAPMAP